MAVDVGQGFLNNAEDCGFDLGREPRKQHRPVFESDAQLPRLCSPSNTNATREAAPIRRVEAGAASTTCCVLSAARCWPDLWRVEDSCQNRVRRCARCRFPASRRRVPGRVRHAECGAILRRSSSCTRSNSPESFCSSKVLNSTWRWDSSSSETRLRSSRLSSRVRSSRARRSVRSRVTLENPRNSPRSSRSAVMTT